MTDIEISDLNSASRNLYQNADSFLTELETADSRQIFGGHGGRRNWCRGGGGNSNSNSNGNGNGNGNGAVTVSGNTFNNINGNIIIGNGNGNGNRNRRRG